MYKIPIYNNIKKYRTLNSISQVELADSLCIERTYLSKLENHKYSPSAELMFKACKYFNLSLGQMFYIREDYK